MSIKLSANLKLRLSDEVEEVRLPEGLVLLKQTRLAAYMCMSEQERDILARFDGQRPLQDIISDILTLQDRPNLRRLHDLFANAMASGILVSPEDTDATARGPWRLAWPIGWGRSVAVLSTLLFVVLGTYGFIEADILPQKFVELGLGFWGMVYVWVAVGLSLANILAACVLRGFGRTIYRPRLGFTLFVLHFKVDRRDTFMGGRPCMVAVAMQMLSAPFILVGIAALPMVHIPGLALGGILALFCLTWPFGRTPMHDIIAALLSRRYEADIAGASFLGRRLLPQMLDWSVELKEGAYLTGYTVYTLAWMAALIVLGLSFFHHHAAYLVYNLLNATVLSKRLSAALVLAGLLFGVVGPLLYELVLVLSNVYSMMAPKWFTAERAARTASGANKPPVDEIAERLRDILLFAKLPENKLRACAETMAYQSVSAGTILLRQGDVGDHLYVLYSGELEVLADDESGARHVIARIHPNTVFGEVSLLTGQPRTASIKVSEDAGVLALAATHVDRLIVGELGRRQAMDIINVGNFLGHVDMFSRWPRERLSGLSDEFTIVDVNEGDAVITQGAANDAFYLIVEGRFKVVRDGRQVATLTAGNGFGEISLLRNMPTTADVVALSPGRLVSLNRDHFAAFVCRDFEAGFAVEVLVQARLSDDGIEN